MKSKQLNVRLSAAAWKNLEAICAASGSNKTAVIEMALAELAQRAAPLAKAHVDDPAGRLPVADAASNP